MDDVARSAALVLAAVLTWAGVVKLARPATTKRSFGALGVPVPHAAALLVPLVEIATGAALVVRPEASWVAVALLLAFTAVLASAISRGIDAPCSCFGSSRAAPVSSTEIVRNGMLIALAVLASGAPARWSWPDPAAIVAVASAAVAGRLVLAALDARRARGAPRAG